MSAGVRGIWIAAALAVWATGAGAQTLRGVNLAGAAFSADKLPGRVNFDFVYPPPAEMAYFARRGMTVFRLSVLWERLQPTMGGTLDAAELGRLTGFIEAARALRVKVIVDVHNYGEYRSQLIGSAAVPVAAFVDLWTRLARVYGRNDSVLFGLMNEPKLADGAVWLDAVQRTITAVRQAGARNTILVPGIGWDGAHSFVALNSALDRIEDPLGRSVMEAHEYFDRDSSGTHEACVGAEEAVGRFRAMTLWLRSRGRLGFLGEFGVSRRPECLEVLRQVVGFLRDNKDVWLGWTYWAAGPIWGEYMYTLEPAGEQDRPQMQVLQPFLRP